MGDIFGGVVGSVNGGLLCEVDGDFAGDFVAASVGGVLFCAVVTGVVLVRYRRVIGGVVVAFGS